MEAGAGSMPAGAGTGLSPVLEAILGTKSLRRAMQEFLLRRAVEVAAAHAVCG